MCINCRGGCWSWGFLLTPQPKRRVILYLFVKPAPTPALLIFKQVPHKPFCWKSCQQSCLQVLTTSPKNSYDSWNRLIFLWNVEKMKGELGLNTEMRRKWESSDWEENFTLASTLWMGFQRLLFLKKFLLIFVLGYNQLTVVKVLQSILLAFKVKFSGDS